ncbi:MAG: AlpA family phage regulatory protein [Burkholderiaceae bacterium]|nr:AlpA family phage regulatory protein [Burkholderiaceae bacterium]
MTFQLVKLTPPPPRDRLLRIPDVERIAGIKKSTVYGLMREGKFPSCVRVTRRLSAWPESAVLNWVQQRIREGGAQ